MIEHPIFTLFFDLTVNEGWNLTAMMTYAIISGLTLLSLGE